MQRALALCVAVVSISSCGDDDDGTTAASSTSATAGTATTDASTSSGGGSSTGGTGGAIGCDPRSAVGLGECVDRQAYLDDLTFIADIRVPGNTHWQAVQDLCADRLTELGYDVSRFEYATGVDVIGTRLGITAPDEHVIIGAHYDHIPDCLGADDNATGVAGALEAARALAMGQYDKSVTIACWDEEETGLIGSRAFAESAAGQGIDVAVYYNFEMLGFASSEPNSQRFPAGFELVFPDQIMAIQANESRGDFILLAADDLALAPLGTLQTHLQRLAVPEISVTLDAASKNSDLFIDLRRSDHASFWAQDFPAIFIGDTAEFRNDNYHCVGGPDTIDRLDHDFSAGVIAATVASAAESAGLTP